MKKLILLLPILLLFSFNSKSSHVNGYDMRIEQTGANSFNVFVRDQASNIASPLTFSIQIRENTSNSLIKTVTLSLDSSRYKFIFSGTAKIDSMKISYYSGTTTLANNANGYYANARECCRNLSNNMNTGAIIYNCLIPDPFITRGNSNPKFIEYYDNYNMAINVNKQLDFSCSDSDGDSLVYSLMQSFGTVGSGGGKPYTQTPWNPGYNVANVIGPGSPCTINSSTGIVTTKPAALGNYVIAVKCEEFRNGIKIGEVIRDILIPAHAITSTKIKELENQYPKLSVYPNPSNGNFTLSIEDYNHSNFKINVIDVTGKLVYNQQINSPQTSINLEKLNKGIYFMQLNDGVNQTTKRIVIQ